MEKRNSRSLNYINEMSSGIITLWCYLYWYLFFLVKYFRLDFSLWGTALFMSLIVGTALNLNAFDNFKQIQQGQIWKVIRFFIIPFCVSSYPLLIQNQNFVLIFSSKLSDNLFALIPIILFLILVFSIKKSQLGTQNI